MEISSDVSSDDKKIGTMAFVLAGMSFIPLIGLLFGLISIIRGLMSKRIGGKKVALIGATGICFTVLIYGLLFYFAFGQRGGIYDDLRKKLAQSDLNSLVKTVEFYKIQYHKYPESLNDLKASLPKDSIEVTFITDPRAGTGNRNFYYKKVDQDHYYLRGVAPDGNPFSPGALVPQVVGNVHDLGLLTGTATN